MVLWAGIIVSLIAVMFFFVRGRFLIGSGVTRAPVPATDSTAFYQRLLPLHRLKTSPVRYDWLATHPEPGQDFAQYVDSNPVLPRPGKNVIYVALLGDFDATRRKIVEEVANLMRAYFGLPVKFIAPVSLEGLPANARRVHPLTSDPQLLSTYLIEEVLLPKFPEDAFCLIGFTVSDLWPGEGWNFVFGQASMTDRVGVWSVYRDGDPNESAETYRLCLRRAIKTGTHEVGHMLGMYHCVFYECAMNGSNHRLESDRRPLWLCPVCLRKLVWATGLDPAARFKALARVCGSLDLQPEAEFYSRCWQNVLTSPAQ